MKRFEITSASNAALKKAQRLVRQPKFARESGVTLADGIHLALELCSRPQWIESVFIREGSEENPEIASILKRLDHEAFRLYVLPRGLFSSISTVENGPGIVCEIMIPAMNPEPLKGDIVYLDGVQDPGNMGTIIRLSLAAGVSQIALSDDSAYVWAPKLLRAGMGAHFSCRFITGKTLEALKAETQNECLVADARGGRDLFAESWGELPTIWVFGSEGRGVSEKSLEAADKTLLIPIDPRVESLNVASAASVCLFEQRRRRLLGDR